MESGQVHCYVGLDRNGKVVEVRSGDRELTATQAPAGCAVVETIEVLSTRGADGEPTGTDPACVRLADGRVYCF